MKKSVMLVFLLAVLLAGCRDGRRAATGDARLLNFTVQDIHGRDVDMRQFLGKVIILDFWDTWCGPCKMEIPHFVALQSQYKSQGLEIIGLALARHGKEAVRKMSADFNINYTSAIANEAAYRIFGMPSGIPTTYIIDRKGNIVEKVVGARDRAFFEQKIKALL